MTELKVFDPLQAPSFLVQADLQRLQGTIQLSFSIAGAIIPGLYIPARVETPAATDDLWKTTCFEVFLQEEGQQSYEEWNFSPSTNWAHYHFHSYRERDLEAECQRPLSLVSHVQGDRLTVLTEIRDSFVGKKLHYSLTAVVDTKPNQLSYWALAHPGPKPEFHSAASRVGRA